jgi:hypothetical protein
MGLNDAQYLYKDIFMWLRRGRATSSAGYSGSQGDLPLKKGERGR